jgi:hypothetical protein
MASASTSTSSPAQRFLIILEREAAESSRRGCGLAEKCRTQSSDLAGGYVGCGGRALGGDRARSVRRRDGPLCSVAAGAMARQCQASVRLGEGLGGRIRARCGGRGCGGSCSTIRVRAVEGLSRPGQTPLTAAPGNAPRPLARTSARTPVRDQTCTLSCSRTRKRGVGSPAHGRAARAPLALVRRAHAARDPMPVSVGRGPPLSYSWLEVAAEGWRGRRAPPTPATSIADWITGRPSRQLLRSRLRSPDGCDGSTVCGICPAGQTPLAAIRRDASPSLLGPVG